MSECVCACESLYQVCRLRQRLFLSLLFLGCRRPGPCFWIWLLCSSLSHYSLKSRKKEETGLLLSLLCPFLHHLRRPSISHSHFFFVTVISCCCCLLHQCALLLSSCPALISKAGDGDGVHWWTRATDLAAVLLIHTHTPLPSHCLLLSQV